MVGVGVGRKTRMGCGGSGRGRKTSMGCGRSGWRGGGVTRLWDAVGVSGGRGRKTSMGFDRSGRLKA